MIDSLDDNSLDGDPRNEFTSRDTDDEILAVVNRDLARRMSQYSARHRRGDTAAHRDTGTHSAGAGHLAAPRDRSGTTPTRDARYDARDPGGLAETIDGDGAARPDENVEPDDDPDERTLSFWAGVGIEPVELDLPSGSGYTLRHFVPDPNDADGPSTPVFLGTGGRIALFRTTGALARYVQSDEVHDLSTTPYWWAVFGAVDLDFTPERLNRYELDLVVDIVRAGLDAWGDDERETLMLAGELGRDIAGYTGSDDLWDIVTAGSALDTLDDDLRTRDRAAVRRMRRHNYHQLALTWRREVGLIERLVDWHD